MILPSRVSCNLDTCEMCFSSFLYKEYDFQKTKTPIEIHLSIIPLPSVLSSSSGPNLPPCRSSTSFSSAWKTKWNAKEKNTAAIHLQEVHLLQASLIMSLKYCYLNSGGKKMVLFCSDQLLSKACQLFWLKFRLQGKFPQPSNLQSMYFSSK